MQLFVQNLPKGLAESLVREDLEFPNILSRQYCISDQLASTETPTTNVFSFLHHYICNARFRSVQDEILIDVRRLRVTME
jgi:hypothetical protein